MLDMLDLKEDFSGRSVKELEDIKKMVEDELENAASQRYNYLRDQMLSAYRMLQKEFPCSEIWMEDSNGDEIELMDYDLSEENFHQ